MNKCCFKQTRRGYFCLCFEAHRHWNNCASSPWKFESRRGTKNSKKKFGRDGSLPPLWTRFVATWLWPVSKCRAKWASSRSVLGSCAREPRRFRFLDCNSFKRKSFCFWSVKMSRSIFEVVSSYLSRTSAFVGSAVSFREKHQFVSSNCH